MRGRVRFASEPTRPASAVAGFLLVELVMGIERRLGRDKAFKQEKLSKTTCRRKALDARRRQAELKGRQPRNDLLPDLQVRPVLLSELRPSSHRTRRTDADHIERLMCSISDLGFTVPIIIAHLEIVDGHTRVEAAKRLGLDRAPAIEVSHLSEEDIRKLRLAANRLGELGEWDIDLLRIEFQELIVLDVDLGSTGFTLQEQDIILLDLVEGEESDEDEPGDPPENPVTRLGDIWEMNWHRVICGNALEAEACELLLRGEPVHTVLIDPPYNVKIKGNVSGLGKKVHGEFVMASGEMSDEEFQAFLDKVMALLATHLEAGSVLFVFMDWRSIHRLYQAGFAAGLNLLNLVVWNKQAGGMGGLYRSQHELIAVFCSGERPHTNNVLLGKNGRDRSNVWSAAGANRRGSSANEMLGSHPTSKPVELCIDALLDVTEPGMTVLDAFLGSGTTLIAAEKTGRRCCGMELEPGFVDVSVRRWERLTGRRAVLAATGESFESVANRRRDEAQGSADHSGN